MFALPHFRLFRSTLITNIASVIYDTYFRYTSLLINADTAATGMRNNNFIDSSANGFNISTAGSPTQGSFTPFHPNGWSVYFNGSSRVTAPAGSNFAYGLDAFTIEAWVKPSSFNSAPIIFSQTVAGTNYFVFQISTSGQLQFVGTTSGGGTVVTASSGTLVVNQWSHVTLVREGSATNQLKFYIDGSLVGVGTTSVNYTNTSYLPSVGAYTHTFGNNNSFAGNISNFRIVKGQALYTGTFIPATSALINNSVGTTGVNVVSSLTGTVSLLTLQNNRFKDNSSSNATLATAGLPQIVTTTPFLSGATYSPLSHDGSMYFNGSTDYLSTAANANFALSTNSDFTIEGWLYPTSGTDKGVFAINGGASSGINILIGSTGFWRAYIGTLGGNTINSAAAVVYNKWTHLAVVRNSGRITMFVDGLSSYSAAGYTGDCGNSSSTVSIGAAFGNARFFAGYISDFRVVKGTAVYALSFTPPTGPLSAIANTSLLLRGNNGAIVDATGRNTITVASSAQVDTATKKFGAGSLKFNGTSDYITVPENDSITLASGTPFTIEGWFYPTTSNYTTYRGLISKRTSATGSTCSYELYALITTGYISFNNGTTAYSSSSAMTLSAWNHIAAVYDGSNLSMYKDGTRIYGPTAVSITNQNNPLYIGMAYPTGELFQGYMDDVRITKGVARYSGSSFTIPTTAFPTQ